MLRILIFVGLFAFVVCYLEYAVESDRICTPIAKKRKLQLGYNERSGILVKETRYFDNWSGSYEFNCNFHIEALSKDGIAVVIQKLEMRKNETTGECIDYIQFLPDQGVPSNKICGALATTSPDATNTFVDYKGDLSVTIHVQKSPLKQGQKIDLELVFTAYKLCAKNPVDYKPCNDDLCIWKGFFNDDLVNCPFTDCIDENSCDIKSSKGYSKRGASSSPWYYALLMVGACLVFLVLCLYLVFHKRRPSQRGHRAANVPQTDCEQSLSPTAPPLYDNPKDRPPPYESLFPNQ